MLAKILQNANKSCWQIIKKNANILLTVNIVSNAKNIRKSIWICYFFYQGEKCTLIRERLRKKKRARKKNCTKLLQERSWGRDTKVFCFGCEVCHSFFIISFIQTANITHLL